MRVPPLIKTAADYLWANNWDASSQSFWYYTPVPGANSMSPVCSSPTDPGPCKATSPDLNLLIVPLFGWVYQHTGDITYRNEGDAIFNSGVSGAFLGDGKHFSQNYRWSGQYITWRQGPLVCDLNNDGVVNVLDVQLSFAQTLGLTACTKGDITGSGTCDVGDSLLVVKSAVGNSCQ